MYDAGVDIRYRHRQLLSLIMGNWEFKQLVKEVPTTNKPCNQIYSIVRNAFKLPLMAGFNVPLGKTETQPGSLSSNWRFMIMILKILRKFQKEYPWSAFE